MLNRTPRTPVGGLIRQWRQRRRLSQLDLACDAGISTRHLSFVETGRAQPSRDMLLHLSEQLDVPVRERNVLLVAAGYAPIFPERPLEHPALAVRPAPPSIWCWSGRNLIPLSRSTGTGASWRAMRRCRSSMTASLPS